MVMDVVDCEIKGAEMPFDEVELDPGEVGAGLLGDILGGDRER